MGGKQAIKVNPERRRQRIAQIALVEDGATRQYGLGYSNIYVTIPPSPGSASLSISIHPKDTELTRLRALLSPPKS